MSFDFESLKPSIRQILSAPGTDLNTISAKRVRRQLTEINPSLTTEWMKENREEVDQVIASVYESVRDEAAEVKEEENVSETSRKRERSEDYADEEPQGDEGNATPPPPKKPKKGKLELEDERLARQISNEINGSGRRSNTRSRANGSTPKKPRKKKSTATVNSDDGSDGDDNGEKKPKKKGGAKGGFAKEYTLSEPLASLLQAEKMSRPQVVKKLWDHIKANELQNPSNRREIICDPGMKAIFKSDKIDMFSMNKVLGSHLYKDEA